MKKVVLYAFLFLVGFSGKANFIRTFDAESLTYGSGDGKVLVDSIGADTLSSHSSSSPLRNCDPNPTAPGGTICSGTTIILQGKGKPASNPIYTWTDPTGQIVGRAEDVAVTNPISGKYTLDVLDGGCVGSGFVIITVTQSPQIIVTAQNGTCGGSGSVSINVSNYPSGTAFDVDLDGDGNYISPYLNLSTDASKNISITNLGNNTLVRNVKIKPSSGGGCESASYPINTVITNTSSPTNTTSITTMCADGSVRSLTTTNPGGTWSLDPSSTPGIGTVDNTNAIFTVVNSSTISGTAKIVYTLNGCPTTRFIPVTAGINAGVSGNTPLCTGQTLNLIASGGTSYLWTLPNNTTTTGASLTISNVTTANAGRYTVKVTSNTCSPVIPVDVVVNATPVITNVSTQNSLTCNGTGSATISISGGAGNIYDVDLDGNGSFERTNLTADGSGNIVISNLASGTVVNNVKVKLSSGNCPSSAFTISKTITSPTAPVISNVTTQDAATCGGTGSATISISGGSGNYDVDLDGNGTFERTNLAADGSGNILISNLASGSVVNNVIVKSVLVNCPSAAFTINKTISSPSAPVISNVTTQDATICGGTGSATISITGGSGNYDVDLDGDGSFERNNIAADGSGNIVIANLASGAIVNNVKVKPSSVNCPSAAYSINKTISAPGAPVISNVTTQDASTCGGTGSATITINGGSGNYDVDLDGNGSFERTNLAADGSGNIVIANLASGTVVNNVKVQPSSVNCPSAAFIINKTISSPSAPVISNVTTQDATTCGGSGSATISITGGSGNYDVDLDGNGSFELTNLAADGSGNIVITNLAGGTVVNNVKVKPSSVNCPSAAFTINKTISSPTAPVISNVTTQDATTCGGTGSATISITGGSGNYDVDLDGNGSFELTNLTADGTGNILIANLASGTVVTNVKVKPSSVNCSSAAYPINKTISSPTPPVISNVTTQDATTCGGTGSATISITGGSGNYDVDLDGNGSFERTNLAADGSGNILISNLASGTVVNNVKVKPSLVNCPSAAFTINTTINSPSAPVISNVTTQDATTCGGTGSATISITGGSGNYDVDLDGNGSFELTNIAADGSGNIVITNLAGGTVVNNVKVKPSSINCSSAAFAINKTISSPTAPVISNVITQDATSCGGTGSATISISGGAGNYDVDLDGNGSFERTNLAADGSGNIVIANLVSGTVVNNVVVKPSSLNCSSAAYTINKTISAPTAPVISNVTAQDATTCGGTGSATISISGGSGNYDVDLDGNGSFELTNLTADGSGNIVITNLAIGSLINNVKVKPNSVNCPSAVFTINKTISSPAAPVISNVTSQDATVCGGTGSATINITSPSGNYDVDLDGDGLYEAANKNLTPDGSGNILISSLAIGSAVKNVKVKSLVTNCESAVFSINKTISSPGAPSNTTDNTNMCSDGTSIRPLTATPSGGAWTLDASSTPGIGTVDNLAATFTVGTVTGTAIIVYTLNGCTSTKSISVVSTPTAAITQNNSPICAGGTLTLTATGGSSSAIYTWTLPDNSTQTGSTLSIANATLSGPYSVVVKEGTCTSPSVNTSVTIIPSPIITVTVSDASTCGGTGSTTINVSNASGNYDVDLNGDGLYEAANRNLSPDGSGDIIINNLAIGFTVKNVKVKSVTGGCESAINPVDETISSPGAPSNTTSITSMCANGISTRSLTGSPSGGNWSLDPSSTPGIGTVDDLTATFTVGTVIGTAKIIYTLNGCTATKSFSVIAAPVGSISGPLTICSGQTLNLTASGGSGSATYTWTLPDNSTITGANLVINNATLSGNYSVKITDGACVSAPVSANVTINPTPTITVTTQDATTCGGTGSATIHILNPSGNYDVDLDGDGSYEVAHKNLTADGSGNIVISNLAIGTTVKNVKVKSTSTSCESAVFTINTTIGSPGAPSNTTDNSNMCADGTSTRALTATPAGGTWSLDATSTPGIGTVDDLTATFTVGTVTGTAKIVYTLNGCTATRTISVIGAPVGSIAGTLTICSGQTLSLSASGGSGSATYTWTLPDNSTTIGANLIINNATLSGNYSVVITDGTCSSTPVSANVTINSLPSITVTTQDATTCGGTGSATINISNSSGNYDVDLDGDGSYEAAHQNLTADGSGNIVIGNLAIGTVVKNVKVKSTTTTCESPVFTINTTIGSPGAPSNNTDNSNMCADGTSTRALVAVPTGGIWSLDATSTPGIGTVDDVAATFTVGTVSGTANIVYTLNGCTATKSISIVAAPVGSISGILTICAGQTLNLTASGGSGSATYRWTLPDNNTATGANLVINNATLSGNYSVVITDGTCSSTPVSANVTINPLPSITVTTQDASTCGGTGSATINISNPSGNYDVDLDGDGSYEVTHKNLTADGSGDIVISNLPGGTIVKNVKIKSLTTGCESLIYTIDKTIVSPGVPTITTDNSNMCNDGTSTRNLSATPSGGVWSLDASSTPGIGTIDNVTSVFTVGNVAGTANFIYTLNGCSATSSISVLARPVAAISGSSTICAGQTLDLTASGGSGSAIYRWTLPDNSTVTGANLVINNASLSGNYSVIITDGICTSTPASVAVNIIASPLITVTTQDAPSCGGTGAATVNISNAAGNYDIDLDGDGNYEIAYNNLTPDGSGDIVINNLAIGTNVKNVKVRSTSGGCESAVYSIDKTIGSPGAPLITTDNTNMCADGTSQRSLTASPAGGAWTLDASSTPGIGAINNSTFTVGNVAGTAVFKYTVNGCSSVGNISVISIPTGSANSNSPVCAGSSLNLIASGNSGADYSWEGPDGFTSIEQNPIIDNVNEFAEGDYFVKITLNGCYTYITTPVVINPRPQIVVRAQNSSTCGGKGSVNINVNLPSTNFDIDLNGNGVYDAAYQNMPSDASGNINILNLPDGTIVKNVKVKALDSRCESNIYSIDDTIVAPPAPDNTTDDSSMPLCSTGNNVRALTTTTPGGLWSLDPSSTPGVGTVSNANATFTTANVTGRAVIVYTLNGCVAPVFIQVTQGTAVTASSNSPLCEGNNLLLNSTFVVGATYSWTGPAGFTSSEQNPVVSNPISGAYAVTVTGSGCSATSIANVTVSPIPVISVSVQNPATCTSTGTVTINVSNPSGSYNIDLDGDGVYESNLTNQTPNGSGDIVITNLPNGTVVKNVKVKSTGSNCESAPYNIDNTITSGSAPDNSTDNTAMCADGLSVRSLTTSTPGGVWSLDAASTPGIGAVNNGAATFTVSNVAGTAIIVYTLNGCTAVKNIEVQAKPNTTALSNSPVCVGSAINLSSTAGSSNAVYSWTGPNGYTSSVQNPVIPSSTLADAGDYTVTLTDGTCPAATSTVTVSVGNAISTTASSNSPVCVGSAINLSSTAGSGTATYSWTGPNGYTSSVQNPVIPTSTLADAGDYTVTLTDGACPAATSTVTVNVGNAITTTASSNSPVCVGSAINLSSTAGSVTATYSWTGPNGYTSSVQNPVIPTSTLADAGDYTVTLTDGTCPAATSTVTVSVGNAITTTASSNSPVCVGSAINLSSTAGSSNAVYSWTGPNGYTSSVQNPVIPTSTLADAGDYTVTLTDGTCPAATSTVTVSVGNAISTTASSNSPVCVGSAINLSSTAGSSNAVYSWTGPNGYTSSVQNPVIPTSTLADAGDYTVTLTDGSCPAATSTVTVNIGNAITTTASSNSPVCVGSAINLSSTAGSSNAVYSWTGPNGYTSSVQNPVIPISTLADAGDYTVTLTDGACPAATSTVTVNVGNAITTTASSNSPVCVGSAINLSSTAGSSNATYSWTGPNGYTSSVQNPVIPSSTLADAGDYTVTLTDGTCPAATSTVTVSVGNAITTTASSNSPVCVGSTINLSSTAGSSTATYSWTGPNGYTSSVQNPIIPSSTLADAGDYTVTLTDGTCPAATSTVTINVGNAITTTASSNSPVCVGSAINLSSTAGSSNATYSWTGPNGYTSSVQNPVIPSSTLADAGDYMVTLTDGTCPAATSTVTVNVGNAITTTASSNSPVCVGSTINLSSTAGSSTATYSWTGPNGYTSSVQNPIIPSSTLADAGDYTVTLTDGTCPAATSTVTINVGNAITTTASSNSPVCVGSAINLSSTAGSSNATYSWTGPNGYTSSVQNPVIPSSTLADAGDYTVTLTDGTCPAATSTVTINVGNAITTTASSNSPVCVGSAINLSSTAGSSNAVYSWTGPNGFTSALQNPVIPSSTLADAGDYMVTLTDGTCPAATSTVTVSVGNAITTTASSNSPVCVGSAINLSSTAGSSNAVYSWTGPNGYTSSVQNPFIPTSTLADAGDYTVTLTDGTCPAATSTVTVSVGNAISTTASSNSPVCVGGAINLSSTAGSSNATYSWTGPNGYTSSVQNPVIPTSTLADAGDYTVTLTDGTCPAATSTVTVSVGNAISTTASSNSPVCVGGAINLTSTAGSSNATYSWTGPNGYTSSVQNPIIPTSTLADAGDYTVTLTDGTCPAATSTVTVSVGNAISTTASSNSPVCVGSAINLSSIAGSSNAVYSWTGPNGYTSSVQNPVIPSSTLADAGDYTVTLTDGTCPAATSTVTVSVGNAITTTASSNSPVCVGSTINLSSTAGSSTATYSWTGPNGYTSSVQNPIIPSSTLADAGDYTVTLTDGTCPAATSTVTVNVGNAITTTASSNSPVCVGSAINLTSTAGSASATYSWTGPNGFTSALQNPVIPSSTLADAGDYTVTLTDGTCPAATSTVTVSVGNAISTTASSNSPVCVGSAINLSSTAGSSNAVYSWTGPNGYTSSVQNPVIPSSTLADAGDYTVTLTDGTCPAATSTVTVNVGNAITTTASSNSPVCVGSGINLSSTAGSSNAVYSWTGPNGYTSSVQNPVIPSSTLADAGDYTVTLTDGTCPAATSTVTINVGNAITTTASSNSSVCVGSAINLSSTAGSSNAVYSWTGPNGYSSTQQNPTITNASAADAGDYTVTLTDGVCPAATSTVTVNVGSSIVTMASSNSPVCFGNSINLTSTGGSSSATFSWTGPNGFISSLQNPVIPTSTKADSGDYTVTLTDGTCPPATSTVTVNVRNEIITAASSNSPVCFGNSIDLGSTPGSSTATYSWTGPNGFTSTQQNPSIPNTTSTNSGVYAVVLTEGSCSSSPSSVTVDVGAPITTIGSSNSPVCIGSSINLASTAGSSTATYSWTGPNGFTSNLQNPVLPNSSSADAGNYSVVLKEGNCTSSASIVTVDVNSFITTIAESNSPVCIGNPINLSATGSATATYSWTGPNGFTSNLQNSTILNSSATDAGDYSVIITDGNCTSAPSTVSVSVGAAITTVAAGNTPVCNGSTLNLTSTAGSSTATYSWTGPNGFTSNLQNPTISNASSADEGTYYVVLTDGNCSSQPASIIVDVNSPVITTASSNSPVCIGSAINLTSTAGSSTATYSWTGPNGYSSSLQNPILPNSSSADQGTYSVVLTEGNCSSAPSSVTVSVGNVIATTAASNGPVCSGNSINLTSSAGSATATYSWTGPNGFTSNLQNPVISNAHVSDSGTYSVVLMEGNCTSPASFVRVTVDTVSNTIAGSNSPVCNGSSINLTSTAGSSSASYSWIGPNGFTSTLQNPIIPSASSAAAGIYSVTLTEGACSSPVSTVTINVGPIITTTAQSNSPVCIGSAINLTSTTGSSSATYSWTGPNGFTSAEQNPIITNASSADSGSYSVILTEGNCSSPASAVIVDVGSVVVTSAGSNSPVCIGTTINLTATGGSSSASYSWIGPNGFTSNLQNPLISNASSANAGTYSVVLTEGNCTSAASTVTVAVNPAITAIAGSNSPVCYGSTLNLTGSGGSSTATYNWTGPDGFSSTLQNPFIQNANPVNNGTYSLSITDGNCISAVNTITVTINPAVNVIAGSNTPVCIGSPIELSASAGSPTATYSWTGPNGFSSAFQNPVISTSSLADSGAYVVILTEGNCSSQADTVIVNVNSSITTIARSNSPVCNGSSINLTSSAGGSTSTYSWTGPNGFKSNLQNPIISTADSLANGTYSVVVTEGNCTSPASNVTVMVHPKVTTFAGSNDSICKGGVINLTSTLGSDTATYSWTGPNGFKSTLQNPSLQNATAVNAGIYTVIRSEGKCTSQPSSVKVSIDSATIAIAGSNSPICFGSPINLTSSTGRANATYSWTGPKGFTSSLQNPTIANADSVQSGTYTLILTEGKCTSQAVTTISVNPALVVTASSNDPACVGNSINLSSTGGSSTASYSWTGPNGFASTDQNPTIANASATDRGTYSVILKEGNCSSQPSSVTVNVNASIAAKVTSNSPLCEGSDLTLSCKGDTTNSYSWSGPDGFTTTNQNPILPAVDMTNSGDYTVSISAGGCSTSVTVKVAVYAIPRISLSADTICLGDSVKLSVSPEGQSYLWSTGQTGTSISSKPINAGVAKYTLRVINSVCPASPEIKVNVLSPAFKFVNRKEVSCFGKGGVVELTAPAKDPFYTYNWLPNGQTTDSIHATSVGYYTLIIRDRFGCTARDSVKVEEVCEPTFFVPKAFTPNGDGINDSIGVFYTYVKDFEMTIFNRWGETVYQLNETNAPTLTSNDKGYNTWDGVHKGEQTGLQSFAYIIKYNSLIPNDPKNPRIIKGFITNIK